MKTNLKLSAEAGRGLLSWYAASRRILPWREDPTPYHVWLSEIMLQQTRVEAVLSYYRRFLAALPDITALARADDDLCAKLWEGLGYYSRVRNLKKAAVIVEETYGGRIPDTREALGKLPGIGHYTASAILSIAYGKRAAAVDGNLLRIYARLTASDDDIRLPETKAAAEDWFLSWMDGTLQQQKVYGDRPEQQDESVETYVGEAVCVTESAAGQSGNSANSVPVNFYGTFNQALMDLGATVCLPNGEPMCKACPLAAFCAAHTAAQKAPGSETRYPYKSPAKPRRIEDRTVLVLQDASMTAIRKRPAKGLLAGLYEFPNTEGHLSPEEVKSYVRSLGFEPLRVVPIGDAKHIFTHIEWHMTGFAVRVDELREPGRNFLLVHTEDLEEVYPIPSAFRYYREYVIAKMGKVRGAQ